MQDIIVKPIITERSMQSAAKGRYTFFVAMHASKPMIKEVVEKLFKVHVTSVGVTVVKGKSMRSGARRVEKALQPTKKAIVSLKTGEKIALFETQG